MDALRAELNECRRRTRILEDELRRLVDVFIYQQPGPREQIFISYSHHDIKWVKRLKTVLAPIITTMNMWDDSMIRAGDRWREMIQAALKTTKVAVLLVSPEFLESEFIRTAELPVFLNTEKVRVIWVPIRPSLVERTKIIEYQAAIRSPLEGMRRIQQAHALVQIAKVIEEAYCAGGASVTDRHQV